MNSATWYVPVFKHSISKVSIAFQHEQLISKVQFSSVGKLDVK